MTSRQFRLAWEELCRERVDAHQTDLASDPLMRPRRSIYWPDVDLGAEPATPTSTTVQISRLADPEAMIEIEAIAVIDN
jgi:enamine deaminase RidA (YjgF/YER057c/UK114 family)